MAGKAYGGKGGGSGKASNKGRYTRGACTDTPKLETVHGPQPGQGAGPERAGSTKPRNPGR